MSKKMKNAGKRKTVQTVQRGIKAQMQMLGFVRGKDAFLELMTEMQNVEQELAGSYPMVRSCPAGSAEEEECLMRIRSLEDKRFQLLSQLHGNRVQDYHLLSALQE